MQVSWLTKMNSKIGFVCGRFEHQQRSENKRKNSNNNVSETESEGTALVVVGRESDGEKEWVERERKGKEGGLFLK